MTVLLVLVTFIVFLAIDAVIHYKHGIPMATEFMPEKELPAGEAIGGIPMPDGLRYHPGHTWLSHERKNVNRVGADAFAARVLGHVSAIELPKPGHWVRQGQKIFSFTRNGETVEMVSPVEGEVLEVNQAVASNPALLAEDPYGKGWLVSVFSPDEESPSRNLMPKNMLAWWMQESLDRLYRFQPQLAGVTAADGGAPVDDPLAGLPPAEWKAASREFFLS